MTEQEALVAVQKLYGELGVARVRQETVLSRTVTVYEIGWEKGDFYFLCAGDDWDDAFVSLEKHPETDTVKAARMNLYTTAPAPQKTNAFADMLGLGN